MANGLSDLQRIPQGEFLNLIRSKYPQYNDVEDNDLLNRLLIRYPQYKEQVDLEPVSVSDLFKSDSDPEKDLSISQAKPEPTKIEDLPRVTEATEVASTKTEIKPPKVQIQKSRVPITTIDGDVVGQIDMPPHLLEPQITKAPNFLWRPDLAKQRFVDGLVGESMREVYSKEPESLHWTEKFVYGGVGLGGTVLGFFPVSRAVRMLGVGNKVLKGAPKLKPWLRSGTTFLAHGQLQSTSKNLEERLALAGESFATGLLFHGAGGMGKEYLKGVKGRIGSYGSMFGVGYGMSKLGGNPSDEDAIINGALLVTMHGIGDVAGVRNFLVNRIKGEGIPNPEKFVDMTFEKISWLKENHPKEYRDFLKESGSHYLQQYESEMKVIREQLAKEKKEPKSEEKPVEAKPEIPTEPKPEVKPIVEEPPKEIRPAGEYAEINEPKYIQSSVLGAKSGISLVVGDGKSTISSTGSKEGNKVLGKLIEKGLVEKNPDGGHRLSEKGMNLRTQLEANQKLEGEGLPFETYRGKQVKSEPTMEHGLIIVSKLGEKPAYSNGHYMLVGKPSKSIPRTETSPDFNAVMPKSKHSDPKAEPVGWYKEGERPSRNLVVLNDGKKTAVVDAQYYDFIKTKYPNADFRLTTAGKVTKDPYTKKDIDNRFNKVSVYNGKDRVGLLMPIRGKEIPEGIERLISKPKVEKPISKETEIVTDPVEVNKIKNDIQEGELILKSGKKTNGEPYDQGSLESIRNHIIEQKKKIGDTSETPLPKILKKKKSIEIGKVYTKQEMIDVGAGGSLSKAKVMEIPIKDIDGLEPVPEPKSYVKGGEITQPIEVVYEKDTGKYMLYAGNHRVQQAKINGQESITAFVEGYEKTGKPTTKKPEIKPTSQKQPWEMTREDNRKKLTSISKEINKRLELKERIKGKPHSKNPEVNINRMDKITGLDKSLDLLEKEADRYRGHKFQVSKALSDGKPVPKEVLKDYPDLQAEIKPPKLTGEKAHKYKELNKDYKNLLESKSANEKQLTNENLTEAQRNSLQSSLDNINNLIKDVQVKAKTEGVELKAPSKAEVDEFRVNVRDQGVDAKTLEQAVTRSDSYHFSESKAPLDPVKKVKPVSKREIVKEMERDFGAVIRGKATLRFGSGKLGHFEGHTKLIRTKSSEDIYTLSHELAHFIDNKVWGFTINKNRPHFKKWEDELKPLDYDQGKMRTSEGFAEFVRHYLTTGKSKDLAPKFYDYFTTEFAQKNPEIWSGIQKQKDLFTRYHDQGSVERVKSQIDFTGKPPKRTPKEAIERAWDEYRQAFVSDVAFLEKVLKKADLWKKLNPDEDPFVLATALKGKSKSKAMNWVTTGTTDWVGRPTGKGMADIMKPVSGSKKEMSNFLAYAYSRRALSRPDINAGIELKDAEFVFKKFDSKKFRKSSDELSDFMDRAMDYLVQAGGLSVEARDIIKASNPLYLPLKRFFVDQITYMGGTPSAKKIVDAGKPIKKIKGSGRPIINPLESMALYIENIILSADKTRIARSVANLAEREGIGGLITEVPAPMEAKHVSLQKVLDAVTKDFKRFGEPSASIEGMTGNELITLFFQGKKYTGKDKIVAIWENDKPRFYEVHPDLYRVLKGIDQYTLNPTADFIFGKPNRTLKLGAVGLNASFAYIANPFRDIPTYMVYSKSKIANPIAPMLGIASDLGIGTKKSLESAQRAKAMGLDMATIMGRDRRRTKRLVKEAIEMSHGIKGKAVYVAGHPIDATRRIFQVPEIGTRLAEFQRMIEKYEKKYGKDSDSAYLKAFNDAQDITINFSRMGYVGQYLNQIVPFFNPTVQGGSKLVRMAKERPLSLLLKGTSVLTLSSVYSWYLNKDKEWYQNLPAPLKYSHNYIDLSDFSDSNEIVVIPQPHELGTLFGGLPVAYLDEQYEINPDGVKEGMNLLFKNFMPIEISPTTGFGVGEIALIKPVVLAVGNKTWYGADLESMSMQFKEPPDRYRDYTLEVAKSLSRGMYDVFPEWEVSPLQIETIMSGYTGGFSNRIARSYEMMTGQRKIEEKADIPVAGKLFLRKERFMDEPPVDFKKLRRLKLKRGSKKLTPREKVELRLLEKRLALWRKRQRAEEALKQ